MKFEAIAGTCAAVLVSSTALAQIGNWTRIGFAGQPISACAVSPNWPVDRTIVAGDFFNGQFHRSNDGGVTWQTTTPFGSTSMNINDIQLSPNFSHAGDQTIIAATNEGPFRSTNGGGSFVRSIYPSAFDDNTFRIRYSKSFAADARIYAASNAGVLVSNDGGASFVRSTNGVPGAVHKIDTYQPQAAPATIFAGTYGGGVGVYRSNDSAQNFSPGGGGLPPTSFFSGPVIQDLDISPNFGADNTVFTNVQSNSPIFRSTNGGASWQSVLTLSGTERCIAFSPNFASDATVFAASSIGAMRMSRDGGSSWLTLPNVPSWAFELYPSPDYARDQTLFVPTRDGLWKLTIPEPATYSLAVLLLLLLRRGTRGPYGLISRRINC